MIGATVSHYRIVEKLGQGAMGVVYKAEDTKLDRFVALKFFPVDMSADKEKKERFIQEARAASAMDHANICTIHEIDETEDGQLFICMPFYEGETLTEKINRGPLKLEEVIDFSIQVAQGMEKAHQKGIVHRDIKPQNLIVTNDGVVKIVDFGLAKLLGEKRLTREGITVGTIRYMSPEQARGNEVDQQTDIWSFGIVMYEMLTGQMPFMGEDGQAVIYSILQEEPEPITGLRSKIPLDLEKIVNKCLAKECSLRYQHFDELIVDLRRLQKRMTSEAVPAKSSFRQKVPEKLSLRVIIFAALLAVIIIAAGYFFSGKGKQASVSGQESFTMGIGPSIAVLPFKDISPDKQQEYICEGMVEELIYALTRIEGMHVASRTSTYQFKGEDYDIREIGEKLNVKAVLEGSVRKVDKKLIITARLINVSNGYQLWGEKFQGKLDNIFAVQDEIAEQIVNALKIKLAVPQKVPLIKRYTENIEAYTLYLKGRHFWSRRMPADLVQGIAFFRKAIEKDANYALAYVGLADSYNLLTTYGALPPKKAFPGVKDAALKALEIDNNLGEAHNSLAAVKLFFEWDFEEAEREFKRAIELSPNFVTAHEWYAKCLAVTHRVEESLEEMKRAVEIEPLSVSSQNGIGRHLYFAKRYDAAIEQFKKVLELDPNCFYAMGHLGQTYVKKGMYREAIEISTKVTAITKRFEPAILAGLGYTYGISGKKDEALSILKELKNLSRFRYVRPTYIAAIYMGLGDNDNAFQWLEKAYTDRCYLLIYLEIEHMYEPIRDDPRFAELVRKVGLRK